MDPCTNLSEFFFFTIKYKLCSPFSWLKEKKTWKSCLCSSSTFRIVTGYIETPKYDNKSLRTWFRNNIILFIFFSSIGPDVVIDNKYLDMGVVESGKFVAKSFKIFNNTEVSAAFQVNLSQETCFVCVFLLLFFVVVVQDKQVTLP